jgi:exodeoxyribonuclease V gamma subunit
MAFRLVRHHNLSVLAECFSRDTASRSDEFSPLEPDYLVVQTPGMKKWLALQTAFHRGSFVRFETLSPVQLLMKLGFLLLRQKEENSIFDKGPLAWAIFHLLQNKKELGSTELAPLASFLKGEGQTRTFSLASALADLFDQYLLYRPDWLGYWEKDQNIPDPKTKELEDFLAAQSWQKPLWQKLVGLAGKDSHRAGFFSALAQALEHPGPGAVFPRRVSLFGLSLLPPIFLKLFSLLGESCPVTLYLQVPSTTYWGDLRSLRTEVKSAEPPSQGSRVLGNLGATGRQFFDLILDEDPLEDDPEEEAAFDTEPAGSLLKTLQNDIRSARPPRSVPLDVHEDRWSIRFARCANPLREVEVLLDLILETLSDDPSLSPSEILVITPDLATWGSLVDLVFANCAQTRGVRLPYDVAAPNRYKDDLFFRHTADLLNSPQGRFTASAVLSLFANARELQKGPLGDSEREVLTQWCLDAGIRWGLSGESKETWSLPPDPSLSWQEGLDRLFAGWTTGGEEALESGLFPSSVGNLETAELLGELASFVRHLQELDEFSRTPRPFTEWLYGLVPLLETLLPWPDNDFKDEASPWDELYQIFSRLGERLELAQVTETLEWNLVQTVLVAEIQQVSAQEHLLTGRLTVSEMLPLRAVPFRVVAMLGMNAGFPRDNTRAAYDLIALCPRTGDRNQLESDRYLFLETLLAAQDRLILTASGLTDKRECAPESSAVSFLIGELDREYRLDGEAAGKKVSLRYPLSPASPLYTSSDERYKTWNTAWFNPRPRLDTSLPLLEWRAPEPPEDNTVDGKNLLWNLSKPLETFLRYGCGLSPRSNEVELPDTELFELTNLDEWKLRDTLLRARQKPYALERFRASGGLPPGPVGSFLIQKEQLTVEHRLKLLTDFLGTSEWQLSRIDVDVQTGSRRWHYEDLAIQSPQGWVFIDAGNLKTKRRLHGWLAHLFSNLEKPSQTILVTLDGHLKWRPLDPGRALSELEKLYGLSRLICQRPVAFFHEASWVYFENSFCGTTPSTETGLDKSWKEIKEILYPQMGFEYRADPWMSRLFENCKSWQNFASLDEFQKIAQAVFAPLQEFLDDNT